MKHSYKQRGRAGRTQKTFIKWVQNKKAIYGKYTVNSTIFYIPVRLYSNKLNQTQWDNLQTN